MIDFVAKRLLSLFLSEDILPTTFEVDYYDIHAQIGIKKWSYKADFEWDFYLETLRIKVKNSFEININNI